MTYSTSPSPTGRDCTASLRFAGIVRRAHEQTGHRVAILVDEYDKPLLQAIGNKPLQEEYRNILKPFYGVLKTMDGHIRFAMLTGVTKFGKVSVFSDLNNLKDISMLPQYVSTHSTSLTTRPAGSWKNCTTDTTSHRAQRVYTIPSVFSVPWTAVSSQVTGSRQALRLIS